jgi:MarR family transcriptional regulator for hemolysin
MVGELQNALIRRVPQIARAWGQLADRALAEFRISASAGWCLVHLAKLEPEAKQADLASQLGITQPSLVRTLDQLQAMGLIERVAHSGDKRSNRVAMTDAGRKLADQIETRLEQVQRELLDGVPDAAVEISVNLLELLGRRMADRR